MVLEESRTLLMGNGVFSDHRNLKNPFHLEPVEDFVEGV